MPRNSQGLYTLPPGNPVVPNTLIESQWANDTLGDVAQAITDSLPRNGSAPMTGPLTLAATPPTQPRHAASKSYVDGFVSFSTGLPVGSVIEYAGATAPNGFIICHGQPVSRTTFAALFAAIGTTYGSGDGATTFNVPNRKDLFPRGRGDQRTLGSIQSASLGSHTHALSDPGHSHGISNPAHSHSTQAHSHSTQSHAHSTAAHSHSTQAHSHGLSDPGHAHGNIPIQGRTGDGTASSGFQLGLSSSGLPQQYNAGAAGTGISIAAAGVAVDAASVSVFNADVTVNASGVAVDAAVQNTSISGSFTGITIASAGESETRPINVAVDYYIKALQDSAGPIPIVSIDSDDPEIISIDASNPATPILNIHSNVPFGTVKLDQDGKVPLAQSQASVQNFLGVFDASGGQNPSEAFPSQTYINGDTYIVGVAGTIDVFDPDTNVSAPTPVAVGDTLIFVSGSLANPTGWYHLEAAVAASAGNVANVPAGDIAATDVQAALNELDAEKVPRTATTGSAVIPAGTTAQRDATPADGYMRFNATLQQFEGFYNGTWQSVGGGQLLGGALVKAIFFNSQTIAENLTVATGTNGLTSGPVTVNDGFTVTVSDGCVWNVV